MNLKEEAVLFIATGLYIGRIPFGPGTFGSIVGLPFCFILAQLKLTQAIACTVLFIFFAVWMAGWAERLLAKSDPACIVIDEIVGMVAALIGLPFNLATVVFGFIIFRVLDILKPFPIRILDKRISGRLGIVLDDIAAGIFANLLLRIIFYFF